MSLDRVKFKYPEEALAFLKRLEGSLTRLTLDQAFPKENLDSFEMFSFLKMERLEELSLQKVGVVRDAGRAVLPSSLSSPSLLPPSLPLPLLPLICLLLLLTILLKVI